MNEAAYFLTGLAICISVVLSIIIAIHKRFYTMMVDLCEGEARARFWSLAIEVWFFLYSISSALKWSPEGTSDRALFLESISQLKNGLNGTSNAIILFSVGLIVFVLIRKLKENASDSLRRKSA